MRNTRVFQLQVDGGGGTYAANQVARILFQQLSGMSKTGLDGNNSYLALLIIRASQTVLNSTGGSVTFSAIKAHDFIKRTILGGGVAGNYVEFPFFGGQLMRIMGRLMGRSAEHRTDDVIANAGNATDRLVYFLPLQDPRLRKPEDIIVPARSMKDVSLELNYANGAAGGEYGANFSITSGGIDEVSAIFIDKDHFRKETKNRWFEKQLQSVNDTTSLPAGHKYTDVVLVPRSSPAGGTAATFYSTSDITKVEYMEDNELLVRNTGPRQLCSAWNFDSVLADERELPRFELAGSNEFVPIKWASRGRRQGLVAGDVTSSSPQINLTGSLTPTNTSILARIVDPTTEDDLVASMQASGLKPSNDMLTNVNKGKYAKAKSDSKTKVRPDKGQFLPRVLVPNGTATPTP